MRNIIAYFVKYPKAVNILVMFFIVFGVSGVLALKSSFFPLIDSKFISINATFPGASPQEVEEGVIYKIEENLKGVSGIVRVTSTSRENSGTIMVETDEDFELDAILFEVKNAVDKVPSFPVDLEPIVITKVEEQQPTVIFSLTGKNIDLKSLKNVSKNIEKDIRNIEGISQVSVSGFPDEEIEISVTEEDLLRYNLSFDEVLNSVSRTNILVTGGNIKTNREEFLIRASNKNYYANELQNIIVRSSPDGKKIRLNDIAKIRDQFSETPASSAVNNETAIILSVTSTNNEDMMDSANKINQYIDEFNNINSNLKLTPLKDYSIALRQRTNLLLENGGLGIFLVLIFLSLFLNIRLAFWVAFGLPISFLGMLIFAGEFDITINLMSLFGMIVVIGILVDDGIVIAENIFRHYEEGKTPEQAAVDGTMEVLPAIVSAIITTLIAFSTLLLLAGDVGNFFGEVAMIVILTLIVSLVEALIILPSHLAHSKALHKKDEIKNNFVFRFFKYMRGVNNKGFELMRWLRDKVYSPTLKFALKNRFLSFSGFIAALYLTVSSVFGGVIGVTFFPMIDSDAVTVDLKMPMGTNVKVTDSIISVIENHAIEIGKEFEEKYMQNDKRDLIEHIQKNIGSSADNMSMVKGFNSVGGSSTASLEIYLLDSENRPQDIRAPEMANLIRERTGEIIGVEKFVVDGGANFGGSPVAISLLSDNISELKNAKLELIQKLSLNPKLTDITSNDPEGIKEIDIKLNDNAYMLGLSYASVMKQVRAAFFGIEAQRFQRGEDEIRVWVRYDKKSRSLIKRLEEMRILAPNGKRIPLSEIANYNIERGEVSINHLDGSREIQVNANLLDPTDSASDIVFSVQNTIIPPLKEKYPSLKVSFEGQYREANKTIESSKVIFPLALFLIFCTIGFIFRTYSQPFLLLLLIPFSLTTVAWGHLLHGFPINVISLLGIIALIGILVNDGLVLISKFNSNLREGMSFDDSIFNAGKERFRAIFLTSITTIAGLAPIILEKSFQAQLLKPMAISIAYGIGYATFLTLILLPILISFTNSLKVNFTWVLKGVKPNKRDVEAPIVEQNRLEK
ncbi:MAG: RND transporter [Flavobacteriales bacterium]|nr:RND transporter [Flavobacteriales bacterium]